MSTASREGEAFHVKWVIEKMKTGIEKINSRAPDFKLCIRRLARNAEFHSAVSQSSTLRRLQKNANVVCRLKVSDAAE